MSKSSVAPRFSRRSLAARSGLAVLPVLLGLALATTHASAGPVIVPSASIQSDTGLNTVLNSSDRTYQMQVAASQLGAIAVGDLITGLTFRIGSFTTFPSSPSVSFANWDLTLAQATNSIASMSTTFASNMTNAVLVRSGALSFAAGDFVGGATNPSTNPFGPVISFTTPYTYQGGDLVLLISHTAGTSSVGFLDALTTTAPGYGTSYRALTAATYNATTGGGQGFTITQLITSTAVPEPSTLVTGTLAGVLFVAVRLRKRFRRD